MGRKATQNSHMPPGMRVRRRTLATGAVVCYYLYDCGGKPRKEEPLGTDYLEAVRKWAELAKANVPRSALPTFNEAIKHYTVKVLPGKAERTQSDNLKEMEFLKEFFGEAPLDDIEPTHINAYLTHREEKAREWYELKKRVAPPKPGHVRANRELALFSHIFNFARGAGLTKAPNPCAGVKKNKETGREVYVEDDMFNAVYAMADEPLRDAMDLAYLTGQRPADTLNFDERDINKQGELEIQQAKRGKKLRMAVEGELATVIARIRTRKVGYKVVSTALVVNEEGQKLGKDALRFRFDTARDKAGIKYDDFQFRDLRAKAGTDKTDAAGDIREAQKQLGHKSLTMTEHYVRQRRGDKVGPTR